MQRIVRRHEHRHDRFAQLLGVVDDGRQQVLIVNIEAVERHAGVAAGELDLGRHHDDVGRLRIGVGERLVEHEQVVRRANGHQLAIGLGESQGFGRDHLDGR